MRFWTTYRPMDAEVGRRVLSRPDSRGNALEGIILSVNEFAIEVLYDAYDSPIGLDRNGRYNAGFETSIDVILIETY